MKLFLDLLSNAIQDNLVILLALMFTMALFELADLGLGFYIGVINDSFSWKKLFFGLLKRVVLLACVLVIGYGTNLLGLIVELFIQMFGGKFETNIIVSIVEIILVVLAWVVDLTKDIVAKLKQVRTLKYTTYEEVEESYNAGTGVSK